MAISILIYSLLTRYELGVIKALPFKAHLALDILSGLLLIAAPFLFPTGDPNATPILIVLALGELLVTFLTQTESSIERGTARI